MGNFSLNVVPLSETQVLEKEMSSRDHKVDGERLLYSWVGTWHEEAGKPSLLPRYSLSSSPATQQNMLFTDLCFTAS